MALFIAGLFYYPIKSCRGVALPHAELSPQGLRHDRRWMVVRQSDGVFLTQRDLGRMARISAQVIQNENGSVGETLLVHTPKMPLLQIPICDALHEEAAQKKRAVTVWRFHGEAIDEGDETAHYFSDVLGVACRLVRTPHNFTRRVNPERGRETDRVGFADGYPLLATSLASLGELNRRLVVHNKPPALMEQFRPNLVVAESEPKAVGDGLTAFEEDGWKMLHVLGGDGQEKATFRVASQCARCSVTTVDPHTGEASGPEPLHTLAQFRRDADGKVMFGMNLIHDFSHGSEESAAPVLHVGDRIEVTRRLTM